jgi:uncharacterized repeat protein (TIGR01451 family)
MNATRARRIAPLISVILLALTLQPQPAHAQWPPFNFKLRPSYADGRITYKIKLSSLVEWRLSDIRINIPLPEGTRYVEGVAAHPGTQVTFDGKEISFFTPTFHKPIQDVRFVVEVTDTKRTVFATHAWIKWSGDVPGEFLTEDISIDLTRPPLNWDWPFFSMQLGASALVQGDTVAYSVYVKNVGWLNMLDALVSLSLPQGTLFLSSQSSPIFTGGAADGAASFTSLGIRPEVDIEPIRVQVATQSLGAGAWLINRASAFWKNEGWGVGTIYPAEEALATGDLIVQSRIPQLAVTDIVKDVPFAYYDLASVAFVPEGDKLKIAFFTVDDVLKRNDSVEFSINFDTDCRADTGELATDGVGAEVRAGYEYKSGYSYFEAWDSQAGSWHSIGEIVGGKLTGQNGMYLRVPLTPLSTGAPLCWVAQSASWNDKRYDPYPPVDEIVNNQDTRLDLGRLR